MSATRETAYSENVGAEVSEDLKQRVRVAAAYEGVSMSQYIRDALEDATAETLD